MKLSFNITRIILLLTVGILFSCSYYSNKHNLIEFKKSDVDHFPLKFKKRNFIKSSMDPPTFFNLSIKITSEDIERTIDKFKNQISISGKQNDSCFYILNGSYYFDSDKMNDCKNIIPVPELIDDVRDLKVGEDWLLPNDFTFYILDYSNVADTMTTSKNKIYKQTRLTNGFAISKDKGIIIYWFERW